MTILLRNGGIGSNEYEAKGMGATLLSRHMEY